MVVTDRPPRRDGLELTALAVGVALLGGTSAFGRRGGIFGTVLAAALLAVAMAYTQAIGHPWTAFALAAVAIALGLGVTRVVERFGRPERRRRRRTARRSGRRGCTRPTTVPAPAPVPARRAAGSRPRHRRPRPWADCGPADDAWGAQRYWRWQRRATAAGRQSVVPAEARAGQRSDVLDRVWTAARVPRHMSPVFSRARTSTGAGVIAILLLVLVFGNQAYADWVATTPSRATPGICFLSELAWPRWYITSGGTASQDVIASDVRALLLIVLVAVIIGMAGGQRQRRWWRVHPRLVLGDPRGGGGRRC